MVSRGDQTPWWGERVCADAERERLARQEDRREAEQFHAALSNNEATELADKVEEAYRSAESLEKWLVDGAVEGDDITPRARLHRAVAHLRKAHEEINLVRYATEGS